jgi:hypothetical protein
MSGWAAACAIVMSGLAEPPVHGPDPAPAPGNGTLEGARLVLRGADGSPYLTIEQAEGGNAALSLLDRAGVARVELSLLDDATPRVVLRDGRGTDRAKLLLMPEGSPMLLLKDRDGRTRTEALHVKGAPGFIVFDEAGTVAWAAPDPPAPGAPGAAPPPAEP